MKTITVPKDQYITLIEAARCRATEIRLTTQDGTHVDLCGLIHQVRWLPDRFEFDVFLPADCSNIRVVCGADPDSTECQRTQGGGEK